ncbi:MAG: helix-turn-helix domain-containing protein [Phycisphaerales bacterium]|nr:helix-turn-helix domain-containing protein [Phycisphaerales bacterium]
MAARTLRARGRAVSGEHPNASQSVHSCPWLRDVIDAGDLAPLTLNELRVWLKLWRHADAAGRCYPSKGRIGKPWGMSEELTRRAIRGLERRGLIRSTISKGRNPNHYTLATPCAAQEVNPSQTVRPTPCAECVQPPTNCASNPLRGAGPKVKGRFNEPHHEHEQSGDDGDAQAELIQANVAAMVRFGVWPDRAQQLAVLPGVSPARIEDIAADASKKGARSVGAMLARRLERGEAGDHAAAASAKSAKRQKADAIRELAENAPAEVIEAERAKLWEFETERREQHRAVFGGDPAECAREVKRDVEANLPDALHRWARAELQRDGGGA